MIWNAVNMMCQPAVLTLPTFPNPWAKRTDWEEALRKKRITMTIRISPFTFVKPVSWQLWQSHRHLEFGGNLWAGQTNKSSCPYLIMQSFNVGRGKLSAWRNTSKSGYRSSKHQSLDTSWESVSTLFWNLQAATTWQTDSLNNLTPCTIIFLINQ